ncbi:RRM domain-containing protein [Entamoeba marina]
MSIDLDSFFNKNTNDESKTIIIENVSPKIKKVKTITQLVMCFYYIVIFDTKDAAETTIYINSTEILGMKIDIILISKTQSAASTDPHTMTKLRKIICVRNLGPSSFNEKVQKHFSLCGNIRYMEFNTNDSVTRQIVIEFETEDAALRALAQDSSTFGDRPIRVSPSTHAIKGNQKRNHFMKMIDMNKKNSSGYRRYSSSRDRGYNNRSYRSRSRSYSRERNYGGKYDKHERGYR